MAKKKEEVQPLRRREAAFAGLAKVRDGIKAGSIRQADQVAPTKFCDTGSVAFNDALGGWGWPIGRINIVWGKPSSGKTTLLYHTIAKFQKLCRNCKRPFENLAGPNDVRRAVW